jgi:hypothetical protein
VGSEGEESGVERSEASLIRYNISKRRSYISVCLLGPSLERRDMRKGGGCNEFNCDKNVSVLSHR